MWVDYLTEGHGYSHIRYKSANISDTEPLLRYNHNGQFGPNMKSYEHSQVAYRHFNDFESTCL